MRFKVKSIEEKKVLRKAIKLAKELDRKVDYFYKIQSKKSEINRIIIRGIRLKGIHYESELSVKKRKINVYIDEQYDSIDEILMLIFEIRHLIKLIVNMEQVSLAVHANIGYEDLSDLIDVVNIPLENFKDEFSHIILLKSSFNILKVELMKQKEYVETFDIRGGTIDDEYSMQGDRYQTQFFKEEIVNVAQLHNFCKELKVMLKERYVFKSVKSDFDRAVIKISKELGQVPVTKRLGMDISINYFITWFLHRHLKYPHDVNFIKSGVLFIMSRFKKFHTKDFFMILRMTVLAFNSFEHLNENQDKKMIITFATLISDLEKFNYSQSHLDKSKKFYEEKLMIKSYYKTFQITFADYFPEVVEVASKNVKISREFEEHVQPEWIVEGKDIVKLLYKIDSILKGYDFDYNKFVADRDKIQMRLNKEFDNQEERITYILDNWDTVLTENLKKQEFVR